MRDYRKALLDPRAEPAVVEIGGFMAYKETKTKKRRKEAPDGLYRRNTRELDTATSNMAPAGTACCCLGDNR